MRTVAVWTAFVLAYSSSPFVAGIRYIDPISPQSGNTGDIAEKRVDLTEPTCEELRAMWRYTKRQSRAAKTTTGYSLYPDPFSYNVWKSYPERPKSLHTHRGKTILQELCIALCSLILLFTLSKKRYNEILLIRELQKNDYKQKKMQNIYYRKFYIQISLNKRIVKVSIK